MNSHLANSWTCPVCVPIKDKEASNKLNSSLSKNKQDLINNQQHSKNISNPIRYENADKSDNKFKKQSDLPVSNKTKDQSKSSFSTKSASNNLSSNKPSKFYSSSNNDQSSNTGNRKEIYDFDPDEDERNQQPTKGTKFNKKQEQVNFEFILIFKNSLF